MVSLPKGDFSDFRQAVSKTFCSQKRQVSLKVQSYSSLPNEKTAIVCVGPLQSAFTQSIKINSQKHRNGCLKKTEITG